ncbi:hypothetical protein ABPG72_002108 [Tetrahymena utriculariae]
MKQTISNKIKAVVLWEAGHKTPKSMKRRGNISIRSAARYISDIKKGIDILKQEKKENKKKQISPELKTKIIRKANSKLKVHSLNTISASVGVSKSTVYKVLVERGYKYASLQQKIKTCKTIREKRINFAKKMMKKAKDWQITCFTDECTFWLNKSHPKKQWISPNSEKKDFIISKGVKVHCWGGITSRGALKIEIMTDNMNSKIYLNILKKKVKELEELFPQGYVWQEDNSPVHRSQMCQDFIQKNIHKKLDFPPYSPDLTPIENIWAWLKSQVNKDQPQDIDQLKRSIRKYWNQITPQFLSSYFNSMEKRIKLIIDENGYPIKY